MVNLKQKLSKSVLAIILLFGIVSCSKEDDLIENQKDLQENEISPQTFKFEKIIRLTDGSFYVDYSIKSNFQEDIDYVISLDPKIKVEKTVQSTTTQNSLETSIKNYDNPERQIDILESIVKSNIPKGYTLTSWYGIPTKMNKSTQKGASYTTREMLDDGASGIYVRQNGYQLTCDFYSKGCCWYSVGYYNRGYRTIGPSNTYSYTFSRIGLSPYPGVKMSSYTTLTAWNTTIRSFIY